MLAGSIYDKWIAGSGMGADGITTDWRPPYTGEWALLVWRKAGSGQYNLTVSISGGIESIPFPSHLALIGLVVTVIFFKIRKDSKDGELIILFQADIYQIESATQSNLM